MKALKIILTALVIIIVLLLVIALFLPSSVTIEKQQLIKAPQQIVYYQVDNLQNWNNWSPFKAEDMTNSFEGPAYGVGAFRFWESQEMGSGKMSITADEPYSSVTTSVEVYDQGTGTGVWTFEKTDDGIQVNWSYEMLDLGYPVGKLFGLMANGMMGPVFEKGLNQLKDYCEAVPDFANIEELIVEEMTIISYTDSCTLSDMGPKMGEMYGNIMGFIGKEGIEMAGAPLCFYHKWNPEGMIVVEAAIPITEMIEGSEMIQSREVQACKTVKGVLMGDYNELGTVHNNIDEYLKACGHSMMGAPWEQYITDPMMEPDTAKWHTNVHYPIL
jgi:effector-binding domain-containing protein